MKIPNLIDIDRAEQIARRIPRVNKNLLRNSDFTHPLNQRGLTEYIQTTKYLMSIDQWFFGDETHTCKLRVQNDDEFQGIVIDNSAGTDTGFLTQYTGWMPSDDEYTFSIWTPNGIQSMTAAFSEYKFQQEEWGNMHIGISRVANRFAYIQFRVDPGKVARIKCAKLEHGEYSTLRYHDFWADRYQDMLECYQYYVRYSAKDAMVGIVSGNGTSTGAAYLYLPAEMRGNPEIRSNGCKLYGGTNSSGGEFLTITDFYVHYVLRNILRFAVTVDGTLDKGSIYTIWLPEGSWLELSSEII